MNEKLKEEIIAFLSDPKIIPEHFSIDYGFEERNGWIMLILDSTSESQGIIVCDKITSSDQFEIIGTFEGGYSIAGLRIERFEIGIKFKRED